jgi:hypothetical protein
MMKRLAPVLAGLILVGSSPALAIPHATTPLNPETKDNLVATDTLIRIRLLQTVSSATSHKGDRFDFVIMDDVKVGTSSRVALPAGTRGTGKVSRVSPARGGRVDGYLKLVFDPLMLNDGTEIDTGVTAASVYADANEKNGMAGSVMEIADMAIPGMFIIDFLRRGDNVTMAANHPFHIGVTQDAFLTAGATAVVPPTPVPAPPAASAATAATSSTVPIAAPTAAPSAAP